MTPAATIIDLHEDVSIGTSPFLGELYSMAREGGGARRCLSVPHSSAARRIIGAASTLSLTLLKALPKPRALRTRRNKKLRLREPVCVRRAAAGALPPRRGCSTPE